MSSILSKIEGSFKAAMKGEESVHNLVMWWGVIGYMVAFFIADRIVKVSTIRALDVFVSLLMVVYFSWHFYVLKKCSPKKLKLTKEEKVKLREEARREVGKKIMRKLFLQEPIGKWDPVFMSLVVDVFCVANFLSYMM